MLTEIKSTNDIRKRATLLQQCFRLGKVKPQVLKNFLKKEVANRDADKKWLLVCNKWLEWLDEHQKVHEQPFDKDEFLEQLDSPIPIKRKIHLIKQAIPNLKKEDQDVFMFFEFHLSTDDPRERVLYRKVLDFLQKKGWWNPQIQVDLKPGQEVGLNEFLQHSRDDKLNWLDAAMSFEGSRHSLNLWGMNALTFEADLFVVSKLVKVLPQLYTSSRLYFGRLLDILEIFLKSKDSRVRANSLEGMNFILQKNVNVERIENTFLEMMNDEDGRVKTTCLLLLYKNHPQETFEKIQSIVEKSRSRYELESIRWVIEQNLNLDTRFAKLLVDCDEKMQEIAIFFPDDDLDWISE